MQLHINQEFLFHQIYVNQINVHHGLHQNLQWLFQHCHWNHHGPWNYESFSSTDKPVRGAQTLKMFIINLPTRIRKEIMQWFSLTMEIILSIQFSWSKTPAPLKPELSPLHTNLCLKAFPEFNLADQPI